MLHKCKHEAPTKPRNSPYLIALKKYGIGAQDTIPQDKTPPASNADIKYVQGVVGSILFYARAIDMTCPSNRYDFSRRIKHHRNRTGSSSRENGSKRQRLTRLCRYKPKCNH
eukprot:scaffold62214_cov29-Attheya_sp.AAC.1